MFFKINIFLNKLIHIILYPMKILNIVNNNSSTIMLCHVITSYDIMTIICNISKYNAVTMLLF